MTSPPIVEISRTIVAEMNMNCSPGVRNIVSTSGYMPRFMPASWNSYSKSDTARRPRTTTRALCSCTNFMSSPEKPVDLDVLQSFTTSRAIVDALVEREERPLGAAVGDRDDHGVEEPRRAPHQVLVTERDRIESAGVYRLVVHVRIRVSELVSDLARAALLSYLPAADRSPG